MLKTDPRSHPNIKQLKGDLAGYYRYRVGDYRVVYDIDDEQKRSEFPNLVLKPRSN